MEFTIQDSIMLHCSRCTYATGDEQAMRSHILGHQCPKNAQYYTEERGA